MDQLTDAADFVEPLLQPVAQASTTDSEKGTTVRPCNREITNPNDDDDDSRSQNSSSSARSSSTDSNNNRRNPWKNHNVVLSLVWCVIAGTADSIWTSVVLSGFLLALSSSMGKASEGNTLVGIAEAVQGLTQLVTALPVGYYADRFGKAHAVRFGGYLMTATIAITLWALIVVKRDAEENVQRATFGYWVLVVALGLWGIVNGISYGPSQALFSDSIPKGKRSEMLTWLYSCYMLSSSVGPIVSIILIITVSSKAEDWSIHEIFPVFFVGVCLEIPAAACMFFFSEKYVIPEEEEEYEAATPQLQNQQQTPEINHEEDGLSNPNEGETEQEALLTAMRSSMCRTSLGKAAIPYVLFLSSLIVSLGSGASVKYFPLFFKELGLGSAAVQSIFLAVPVFISAFSFLATQLSKKIGRVETTVLSDVIGTSLLYAMNCLSRDVQRNSDEQDTLWFKNPHRVILITAVYLFRTGIINSCYPLLESILMDNVPSNQRARWKSLESIASFGWTGSALIGGILSDEHSYQFTFTITAAMQLSGGLILLLIQPFVEAEE